MQIAGLADKYPKFPFLSLILLTVFSISCANINKREAPPRPVYRVALINSGAYSALYNQAQVDLGSYREIKLITGDQLEQVLERYRKTTEKLAHAASFAEVADVEGIDFALILLPAPLAYPSGSVGMKSVNWRHKTITALPAVEAPTRPYDWLISARNGWAIIMSNPGDAYLFINDQYVGTAPILLMADKETLRVQANWTKRVYVSREVRVAEEPRVVVVAPEDYVAKQNKKGIYARLQGADEKYGEGVFIAFYVVAIVAGIALLFYSPGIPK